LQAYAELDLFAISGTAESDQNLRVDAAAAAANANDKFAWIQALSSTNLLALTDVLEDAASELELHPDRASIPLFQQIIRFVELLPGDSPGMRDRYCELRWKVAKLLGTHGILRSVDVAHNPGEHRWHGRITFTAALGDIQKALAVATSAFPQTEKRRIQQRERGFIFIGHGHANDWLALKDFLISRLHLQCQDFNAVPTAGIATKERLEQLLSGASFAFLVMTAEDAVADGTSRARENVVHEAGLFQGRLGFARAIILLEDGCAEFSNIHGIGQIRFPKGRIQASFEEIRGVL
jgi:hypothetical protein